MIFDFIYLCNCFILQQKHKPIPILPGVMAVACIGEGFLNPDLRRPSKISGLSPNLLKDSFFALTSSVLLYLN